MQHTERRMNKQYFYKQLDTLVCDLCLQLLFNNTCRLKLNSYNLQYQKYLTLPLALFSFDNLYKHFNSCSCYFEVIYVKQCCENYQLFFCAIRTMPLLILPIIRTNVKLSKYILLGIVSYVTTHLYLLYRHSHLFNLSEHSLHHYYKSVFSSNFMLMRGLQHYSLKICTATCFYQSDNIFPLCILPHAFEISLS